MRELSTIWVTGAGGLIGSHVAKAASRHFPQSRVIALARPQLELTDFAAVERRFGDEKPSLIIHCAAMSRSPNCQANPALARKVNVDATAHLASLAARSEFIFFSSDLVFDGVKGNYVETDSPNPLSIYGETKVAAEEIVLKNPNHVVLRVALNAGTSPGGGTSLNEELCAAWKAGRETPLFVDEFRCPIAAEQTAEAVCELAASEAGGIYHLAGSERLSRLEIGQGIAARHPELNPRIKSGSLREYKGAPRAPDVSMNCARIQKILSFPLPAFTEWLRANPGREV